MFRYLISVFLVIVPAFASAAEALPPGVVSARLLPGWVNEGGERVFALELKLQPGWKTYWRSPGDTGLPPQFDWQDSTNLKSVSLHWPAPEVIISDDEVTLGYHDMMILPMTAVPVDAAKPVQLAVSVELGVCEKVCVPVNLSLLAPSPRPQPDAAIQEAQHRVPRLLPIHPACEARPLADGMQMSLLLPQQEISVVAVEIDDHPEIWVSQPVLAPVGAMTRATADLVPPSGKPFSIDMSKVRITQIGAQGAVEMLGCEEGG